MNPLKEAPEILLREGESSLLLFKRSFYRYEMENLIERIAWRQNKIRLFGKEYDEPRLTAWYGPAYCYSGIQWPEKSMPEFLLEISRVLSEQFSVNFNSVLLNYYRDGNDSMGWHSDNEREMDTHCIASISLGESRVFALRKGTSGKSLRTVLHHGDLLVMFHLQEEWQHSIPKQPRLKGPRLNMSFRRIISNKD